MRPRHRTHACASSSAELSIHKQILAHVSQCEWGGDGSADNITDCTRSSDRTLLPRPLRTWSCIVHKSPSNKHKVKYRFLLVLADSSHRYVLWLSTSRFVNHRSFKSSKETGVTVPHFLLCKKAITLHYSPLGSLFTTSKDREITSTSGDT